MKLSTRARYGLRMCFLLGVERDTILSLSDLVKQTSLSEKYLEQILAKLKKGGLVAAKRGVNGGYCLSRAPESISVKEVLTALDDGFAFTDCTVGKCKDAYCPNKKLFGRIYEGIDGILQQTTLQDMIDDYKCV